MPPLEWSHGVPRPTTRTEDVPPLPQLVQSDSDRDPRTGRFKPANGASRARALRKVAKEQRLLGLDASKCAAWMAPLVELAQRYAAELAATVPQTPALGALAGDAATAAAVYRGLLSLGTAGDMEALKEARAWLREHRQALAVLSALAGVENAASRRAGPAAMDLQRTHRQAEAQADADRGTPDEES
jgi:hypothetical protein